MLAAGGLLTLFDGIVPAFGVLIATALVTVYRSRRNKVEKTATDLAELKATEIPPWGVELQKQNERIIRSLYGDPPWGAPGFFKTFEDFQTDVLGRLDALNGGHK